MHSQGKQQFAARDAALVNAVRGGDRDAFAGLVEAWYDRCWEVSWRILHDRDRAADVAQDTMLAAWQNLDGLESPGSFGGWVLRMSRNRSLDRLTHERRAIPTGDDLLLEPTEPGPALGDPEAEATRSEAHDLVWDAAAALGERDSSILDLHLRHGLDGRELADELGIAPNAANQAMHRMRGRLGTAIKARMLWNRGRPTCGLLRGEFEAAGAEAFGPVVVKLVEKHVKRCDECAGEQKRVASPVALFAAAPLIAAPVFLRTQSAQALGAAGGPVPVAWVSGGAEVAAGEVDDGGFGADATIAAGPRRQSNWFGDGSGLQADEVRLPGEDGPALDGGDPRPAALPPHHGVVRGRGRRVATWSIGALLALLMGAALWVWIAPQAGPIPVAAPAPSESSTDQTETAGTPGASPTAPPATTVAAPPSPPSPGEPSAPAVPAPTADVSIAWTGRLGECSPLGGGFTYVVSWETADAETAALSGSAGDMDVALEGSVEFCGGESVSVTLTASGHGGETTASASATADPNSPPSDDGSPDDGSPDDEPPDDDTSDPQDASPVTPPPPGNPPESNPPVLR
ncbi:MAG: RNA polymerase sigma factor [Pseudoclavibacter sp.]